MLSDIRIKDLQTYYTFETARTPLKFGAVVVESLEFCRIKATVENGRGEVAEGWGGIFLMDFWGWPTTELPHEAKAAAMKELTERYVAPRPELRTGRPPHRHLPRTRGRPAADQPGPVPASAVSLPRMPFLGALVCASPVDAALHDAFGNVNGIDSYDGYGPDYMDDLSQYLGPQYAGKYPQDYLRPQYLPKVPIFHLVGGLDKLTAPKSTTRTRRTACPTASRSGSPTRACTA